jgi:putative ABC transport system permease protein
VAEGDTIRIETPAGPVEREVMGVFYDYSRQEGLVIVDRKDFLQWFPDIGPEGVGIFLPDGTGATSERERLRTALGGRWMVETLLNQENKREVLAIFDRTFEITRAMQVASSVVAAISVLTVLFVLVNERRRDLAVLRALGGTRTQVAGVVLWEGALLGLLGAFAGCLAGLVVGFLLVRIVNVQSFGWSLRFLVPWASVFSLAFWVVMACWFSGLLPAIVSARATPREGLRYEE